jgi:glycosyltransferase involved in cell wall biosynthesis
VTIDLISVMMPVYNGEKYIRQAIESLFAQSCTNWELIVVNDGSTDRTVEILGEFDDPRIRVFHQQNTGEAGARNTALEQLKGEILAFLDADDQFLPDHLNLTASFLDAHPECDGVYSDGYYINQEGVILKPLSARRRGPFQGDIFEEVMRSSDVFGAPLCVVLRTKVIKEYLLNFDNDIIIGPDWDFLNQYSEVSVFGYLNQPTCLYRVHQTNISLRAGFEKRIRSLIRCREKIVKMKRFGTCSAEARTFVFYDLLVVLLRGNLHRQDEIAAWLEFDQLPMIERARLLRLMASRAFLSVGGNEIGAKWLQRAYSYNPGDFTTRLLMIAHSIHPNFCRMLIMIKNTFRPEKEFTSPFADLMEP